MNRKRKWLVHLSRRAGNPLCFSRRIIAPERLESRNAPGVMLPLMGPLFDEGIDPTYQSEDPSYLDRDERTYYRTEAVAPRINSQIGQIPIVEEIQTNEQWLVSDSSITAERTHIPYEVAALDAAFDSLGEEFNNSLNKLSPRLIQPVIMDPTSPHNLEKNPHTPPAPIELPESFAGLGPRLIQPVIMDPVSEHNAPSSTESTPTVPLAATD